MEVKITCSFTVKMRFELSFNGVLKMSSFCQPSPRSRFYVTSLTLSRSTTVI